MDIKNLTTFVQVAELGSFSRAAQQLGYSQPTISVQIRQLEQELGFRLFDRIGHAVRLTDKGRDALLYAQQVCRLCQQMSLGEKDDAAKETLIRLATSDSLCTALLYENYPKLRRMHPGIRVKLTTAGTNDLFHLLDHNEVDIVCTLDSHIYNTNYVIAGERRIGVHFAVGRNNPLAGKTCLTIEDLQSQELLLTEAGMSYRSQLDDWLARASVEIRPMLETGRTDLICSLIEKNAGIGFLPDYVTEQAVLEGSVCRMELEGFQPDLWQQLLYHREKWVSPAMQSVLTLLTAAL